MIFAMAHQPQFIRCRRCCGHVAFTDGKNMYVWGGHLQCGIDAEYSPCNEIWIFRNKFSSWSMSTCKGTLPPRLASPCCVVVFPYLYLFCGFEDMKGHISRMWRLNLKDFIWEKVDVNGQEISPRDKFCCWVYKNRIYCFGGFGGDPLYSGLHERGTSSFVADSNSSFGWNNQLLAFDLSTNSWSIPGCKGKRPLPRAAHASVLIGDKVYLFGGRHMDNRMNDLHCLDLTTMTWQGEIQVCGVIPDGRSWHSLSLIDDDRFLLYGGYSQDQNVFDDAWMYSVSQQSWTPLVEHTGQPRGWHAAIVTDSKDVLIYGGFTKDIQTEFLDDSDFSDTVIRFQFEPYSLQEQCLEQHIYNRPDTWDQLPKNIEEWLKAKQSMQAQWLALPKEARSKMNPLVVSGWQGQDSSDSDS